MKYKTETTEGLTRGWWACRDCGLRFGPALDSARGDQRGAQISDVAETLRGVPSLLSQAMTRLGPTDGPNGDVIRKIIRWFASGGAEAVARLSAPSDVAPDRDGGDAAVAELSKWRVWYKGGHAMIGHAIDGDGPSLEEWQALGMALHRLSQQRGSTR